MSIDPAGIQNDILQQPLVILGLHFQLLAHIFSGNHVASLPLHFQVQVVKRALKRMAFYSAIPSDNNLGSQ